MQLRHPPATLTGSSNRPIVGTTSRTAWGFCLLLVLVVPLDALAFYAPIEPTGTWDPQESEGETPDDAEPVVDPHIGTPKKIRNGFQRAIDAAHAGISFGVGATARRVDSFFADDRFYADSNETYASVGARGTWESSSDDDYVARVRVRLDLPEAKERLRLFIEGGDPEDTDTSGASSIPKAFDDPDYNIGLEAKLEDTGSWDIRPGAGVTSGSPIDAFIRLRATRYEQLDGWLMRFSAGWAEFIDDGTELASRLDFDRKINSRWLFRSGSRIRYRDSKDRTDITHQFSLFQKLGDRSAVAYGIGVRFDDDPDWEVDQYFSQMRFRVRAYKKWFYLEFTPEIVFREEDDFDPTGRLSVGFDAVFGERYR